MRRAHEQQAARLEEARSSKMRLEATTAERLEEVKLAAMGASANARVAVMRACASRVIERRGQCRPATHADEVAQYARRRRRRRDHSRGHEARDLALAHRHAHGASLIAACESRWRHHYLKSAVNTWIRCLSDADQRTKRHEMELAHHKEEADEVTRACAEECLRLRSEVSEERAYLQDEQRAISQWCAGLIVQATLRSAMPRGHAVSDERLARGVR